jgi:hypothetical protein
LSIQNFIPQIWVARLLVSLKKSLVYGAADVANRDYEGEIANQGDTVKITSISRPTISTYTPNSTTISYEELTDAQRMLVIDQAKYFAFSLEDVDERQAAGNVIDEATREAAYGLRDVADQFIAGQYTEVQTASDVGTVSITTADLAYTGLKDLKVKLDEANVPQEGRWVIIPPWYHGLLLENSKFVDASASGSTEPLLNGVVGRALGFSIRMSNNVPVITGDDYAVLAGYRGAISFAEQINQVEALRLEGQFADAIRGLHLYGAKVARPDGIALLRASVT